MRSFWSAISFSSSSSSSSSPSSSSADRPLKGKSKSSNDIFKKAASNEQKRKLTRQKKLRHVTDDEVGLNSGGIRDGPQSWPVSPDSDSVTGSGAPTPLHGVACRQWLKFAVPQPLPRPEMGCQPKQNDGSPRHRTRVGGPASPADTRDPPRHDFGKTADGIVRETYVSTAYHRRGFQQELNVDISGNDFHLHFPAKSAPTSGPSSPVPSLQRYSTVDLFHPSFRVSSDSISKLHLISPIPTPEQTPLHSPTVQSPTKNGISRPHNVVNIHSHHKSHPENSAARADTNNLNVHPLPRPPAVCRQSPSMRHSIDRSDLSSVKGQWQRGKAIGRGTYGNVYIATHRETGATCAVKEVEMIPDDPKCAECMKQLEQEIKFLKELKHPNIVQYYGCEIIEDRFCIYLEYVHPGSVTKYVQEHCGVMTESIVRNFTRHILSGLAYLHGTKTIHRDIKGANLLVNASGVVKLADFGLAKHLVGHDVELSLKGTPHWMAPEVLHAAMRKDANPELAYGVDIWSVGCTVIEMLTGKPPWSECSPAQAMFNVLNKAPAIPQTLSAEGKDFLQWCFQRRPADRPSALKLLEHPFLRSSKDQNVAGVAQEFSGIKIHDLESSSEWTRRNKDVTALSSATRIQQGKLPLLNASNETSRQSCPDSSDTGATPHHSPRCILEILPRLSSPELSSSFNSTSPLNVPNNLLLKDVNNNVYSFSSNGNLNLVLPKVVERKKQSSNVQKEIN